MAVYKCILLPMGLQMDNYACDNSLAAHSALFSDRYHNSAFGRLLTHDVNALALQVWHR